jgi:hypothetical protein
MSSLLRSISATVDFVPSPLKVVVSANPARLLPGGQVRVVPDVRQAGEQLGDDQVVPGELVDSMGIIRDGE